MHRSGTGAATPTSGGKGDSSSSNLGDLESSDKSSVGSQDDKAHAALNIGELLQFLEICHGNWNSVAIFVRVIKASPAHVRQCFLNVSQTHC